MTPNGDIYGFAFIRDHKDLLTSSGPIIRSDWLEKCGLENPETITEFYNALVAFRDQCGADVSVVHQCAGNILDNASPPPSFYGAFRHSALAISITRATP